MTGRRLLVLLLAALALVAAAASATVARDALGWSQALRRGDLALETRTALGDPWTVRGGWHAALVKRLLALDDDLSFRRTAALYRASQDLSGYDQRTALSAAETSLARVESRETDSRRRSLAANLLGVLAVERTAYDPDNAPAHIQNALGEFRLAIRLDPSNDDAKANLEVVLRRSRRSRNDTTRRPGGPGGARRGASIGPPGQDY